MTDDPSKVPELVSAEGVVAGSARRTGSAREELKRAGGLLREGHRRGPQQPRPAARGAAGLPRGGRALRRGRATGTRSTKGSTSTSASPHFKSESYKEAVAPLERELKSRPANLQAKQLLGLSYFMTEDYARAAALLTEVVAAKPAGRDALLPARALARQARASRRRPNASSRQMVALGGNSPQVHILLGRAYYEQNDAAKALEELRAALALDPRVRLAHFYSGLIHLKAGKLDEAAREFEAELALNPSDVQAKYHLGFVALARQETARGLRLMREVVRARPDFANARFELGNALLKQGDVARRVGEP